MFIEEEIQYKEQESAMIRWGMVIVSLFAIELGLLYFIKKCKKDQPDTTNDDEIEIYTSIESSD